MLAVSASHLTWHKSSYSSAKGQNCVEAAAAPGVAAVRDTQNRDLGHLAFPASEWTALLAEVKVGNL
ncbi:DUF397 domain-containing protein [Nocardiopsis trehalosi]|uniref:DUF397 domain-containing protein n=1 Tax=Nocardiopsis trehalosi TaxID=109329 RepID=UPI00082D5D91|nr:DUF397 domain-containing protein [Nocardiopsis trehalosi]